MYDVDGDDDNTTYPPSASCADVAPFDEPATLLCLDPIARLSQSICECVKSRE